MKLIQRLAYSTVNSFNAHIILGLSKSANEKQIKTAYYTLAKQYHPDNNPELDTSQKFQKITKAYELMIKQLANKGQAKSQFFNNQNKSKDDSSDHMFRAYQAYKQKHNIRSDSFHQFMEFYQDYMDVSKQAKRAKRQQQSDRQEYPQPNEEQQETEDKDDFKQFKNHRNHKLELRVQILLSQEEAQNGTEKKLKVNKKIICLVCRGKPHKRQVKCKKCSGSGVHISKNQIGQCWTCGGNRTISRPECDGCGGTGSYVKCSEELVHIRAGIQNNDELIIKGRGHQHHKKGFFGDLLIKVRIIGYKEETNNLKFTKVGFNTYETLKMTVIEAVLGAKINYNTIWGERTVYVRGGIQDGAIIKRLGQGCKKRSHRQNGDHFITIVIEIPLKLTEEQSKIYQRIRQVYKNKTRST